MKPRRDLWGWVIAMVAFIPYCLFRAPSGDLWWLLAQGRWIVEQHRLPTTEVFSFTAEGQPWHNDQWVAALIFWGLYKLGGLRALHVFKGFMLSLTFALLVDSARWPIRASQEDEQGTKPFHWLYPLIGLGCLVLSQKEFFFDVRAYMFTYFFMALWLRWLLQGQAKTWYFLATALVWANLHAGVLVGLALLGVAWVAGHPWLRAHPRVVPLTGLITLCNASGIALHLHLFRLLGSQWGKSLNEWQPLWRAPELFQHYPIYLLVSLIALVWLRPQRWFLAFVASLGLLSLTGWRHIIVFCWLSIPLWCQVGQRLWRLRGAPWPGRDRLIRPVLLTLMLLRAGYWLPQNGPFQLSAVNDGFPRWGADFLSANRLGPRLYNFYGWGGYLILRLAPQGYQVCMDGRAAQVYPIETYRDYLRSAYRKEALKEYLDRYQINTAVLRPFPGEAGRPLLDSDPDWQLIYEDNVCCIFQRKSAALPAYLYPDNPLTLVTRAEAVPEAATFYLNRALQLDPETVKAHFLKGVYRLRDGDAGGRGDLERALELDPNWPNAHFNLAVSYRSSDPQRAYRELSAELRVNPNNQAARQMMAELSRSARPAK